MDKIQKIKEEIERRISNLEQIGDRKEIEIHFPEQFKFIKMYEGLLQFIESLPEEPAVKGITWKDVNILDTLINQVRYEFPNGIGEKSFGVAVLEKFQDYQDDIEEPACEDLEEDSSFEKLLQEIYVKYNKQISIEKLLDIACYFAEWQRQKDKQLVGATQKISHQHGYDEGRLDMREEMMKDAISCSVDWYDGFILNYTQEQQDDILLKLKAKVGDKVKIIIVKED